MAIYGLTATGFVIPTLDEILTEMKLELRDAFGSSIDLDNGILARFVGILAERYALLWEKLEAVYNAGNPDTASGFSLDALLLLRGSLRLEATFSTVVLTLTGTPTTLVPAGQQVATASNTGLNKFLTAAPGTILTLAAWAPSTVYAAGARVTNASRAYHALVGGTSAGSGGPTTTGDVGTGQIAEGPNTLIWIYLGEGTGAIDVPGQAVLTGPIIGASRDIAQIDQPIGGWSSVINVLDASVGFDDQADEAFRISSEEELAQAGTSTADAIKAAVSAVPGVVSGSVTVFHNDSDVTDVDGLPPHSVEVLVRGGDDDAIGEALLAQVAAGIQTFGDVTVTPLDSAGVAQTIKFSRPTERNIGITITLVKVAHNPADRLSYPADGDAQVEAAIVAFGIGQLAGKNAVASSLSAQAFKVAGVLDVTSCLISSVAAPGTPPAPAASTTIAISTRELAVYDTSRITVVSSNGTP